jgi:GxxExxY protein
MLGLDPSIGISAHDRKMARRRLIRAENDPRVEPEDDGGERRSAIMRTAEVYENALTIEMRAAGLAIVRQYGVRVLYNNVVVGEYFPDLLVEDVLLVELKTVKALDDTPRMQCTNYLKATDPRLCLLLNFGKPRLEIKRVVHGL